jgi:RimJ/RimL family protein N-acetyltransferase
VTESGWCGGAPDPWPLHGLVLRTPRLDLRPDDDAGLRELAALALAGVHPPERMPFAEPWTDADPRYLGRGSLQYHWRARAALCPEHWSINFLARRDGRVVGTQSLIGRGFGVTREVSTGSWVGLAHQRQGIGTEMRAAVLHFAFAGLGAEEALSGSFADNPASGAVSRHHGYAPNGEEIFDREGEPARMQRWVLTRAKWAPHRRDDIVIQGLDACLPLIT